MTETNELLTDLQATYGEMNTHRDPETMRVSDDVLALGVLLRREIRMATQPKASSIADLRSRTLERLANYNPRDPE